MNNDGDMGQRGCRIMNLDSWTCREEQSKEEVSVRMVLRTRVHVRASKKKKKKERKKTLKSKIYIIIYNTELLGK